MHAERTPSVHPVRTHGEFRLVYAAILDPSHPVLRGEPERITLWLRLIFAAQRVETATLGVGECMLRRADLVAWTGWTEKRVRTFLAQCVEAGMLEVRPVNDGPSRAHGLLLRLPQFTRLQRLETAGEGRAKGRVKPTESLENSDAKGRAKGRLRARAILVPNQSITNSPPSSPEGPSAADAAGRVVQVVGGGWCVTFAGAPSPAMRERLKRAGLRFIRAERGDPSPDEVTGRVVRLPSRWVGDGRGVEDLVNDLEREGLEVLRAPSGSQSSAPLAVSPAVDGALSPLQRRVAAKFGPHHALVALVDRLVVEVEQVDGVVLTRAAIGAETDADHYDGHLRVAGIILLKDR